MPSEKQRYRRSPVHLAVFSVLRRLDYGSEAESAKLFIYLYRPYVNEYRRLRYQMITACDAGDKIYDDSPRLTAPALRLAGY